MLTLLSSALEGFSAEFLILFAIVSIGGLFVTFYIFGGFDAILASRQRRLESDVAESFENSIS